MRYTLLMLILAAGAAFAQTDGPCAGPHTQDFDFWLGSWDVHARGGLVGRNDIEKVHGGCTLVENYATTAGKYSGSSFNWFDPQDGQWRQMWVDSSGLRLELAGGLHDGAMVMTGTRLVKGETVTDRISWTPQPDGTVRQLWEQSPDGGESWQVLFDGRYVRRESTGGTSE